MVALVDDISLAIVSIVLCCALLAVVVGLIAMTWKMISDATGRYRFWCMAALVIILAAFARAMVILPYGH